VDEEQVFAHLAKKKKADLLDYLRDAYQQMSAPQRRIVFGHVAPEPRKAPDGEALRQEVEQFRRDSLARKYYAPFNVNSKNYMNIPEETSEWCDRFARFVKDATRLTARGKHAEAVACFAILEELQEALDNGKEIIFAEEAGSWMIPVDEKAWRKAYKTSQAVVGAPKRVRRRPSP
jgi:hypothetical protein